MRITLAHGVQDAADLTHGVEDNRRGDDRQPEFQGPLQGHIRRSPLVAPTKEGECPLDLWDVHFREVRLHGAFGRGTAFRRALALMPKLGVKRLVTARFSLDRIEEAFAHATAGRGVKTVITPGKGQASA